MPHPAAIDDAQAEQLLDAITPHLGSDLDYDDVHPFDHPEWIDDARVIIDALLAHWEDEHPATGGIVSVGTDGALTSSPRADDMQIAISAHSGRLDCHLTVYVEARDLTTSPNATGRASAHAILTATIPLLADALTRADIATPTTPADTVSIVYTRTYQLEREQTYRIDVPTRLLTDDSTADLDEHVCTTHDPDDETDTPIAGTLTTRHTRA